MDKNKKYNESEMGYGDSDDEFYNVNLSCTSDFNSDKITKSIEVKKVYSPPRTKVQYDYKFDSSSDDESENIKNEKSSEVVAKESQKGGVKNSPDKKGALTKENTNLPESTFKVVEKINEELKNMKNAGGKSKPDSGDNSSVNHITSSMPSAVQQSQLGIVPPVVVVHPSTQGAVMNMGPMIVPSSIGVPGQTMMPSQNVMGMAGNMLRGPNAVGGLVATPGNGMPSSMIGIPGMVGMQGSVMGMPGNGIATQGNVMGLQRNMINPTAMGGLMQGNMMRMASAGNSMLRMQSPGNSMMGVNLVGIPRPLGIQLPGSMIGNPGGMIMSPGNVMNNSMMNPGSLMVMGSMMGNPGVVSASQATSSSNMVRMASTNSGSSLPTAVPPPFARGKPPAPPGNFRWQANSKMQVNIPKTSSPKTKSFSILGVSSPTSSSLEEGSREHDGDDLYRDDKDNSSDKSSLETDESQSPPRELPNTFKNDGSFMELFKKMKEQSQETKTSNEKSGGNSEVSDSSSAIKKPSVMLSGIVGKRRGGRVLKTGLVKKVKKESDQEDDKNPTDAWSMYMAEVKKYKEASCEEEGKTRPLVK